MPFTLRQRNIPNPPLPWRNTEHVTLEATLEEATKSPADFLIEDQYRAVVKYRIA